MNHLTDEELSRAVAEVFSDSHHGPGVTVHIGGAKVSVYLYDETGILTRDDGGQCGVPVGGDWPAFRAACLAILEE